MDLSKLWQRAQVWWLPVAAGVGIVGIMAWGLAADEEPQVPFVEAGPGARAAADYDPMAADSLLDDPVANIYHTDSAFLSLDTAYSLSPERKKAERERLARAEEAFRRRFTVVARGILAPVYTPELLRGDRETFLQASSQAMQRLAALASSMGRQYDIDPTTADDIGGEVIGHVTDQLRDAAMQLP